MTLVQEKQNDGDWGTDFEIMGAAALMNVRVVVDARETKDPFRFFGLCHHQPIFLINPNGNNHFNWLK